MHVNAQRKPGSLQLILDKVAACSSGRVESVGSIYLYDGGDDI